MFRLILYILTLQSLRASLSHQVPSDGNVTCSINKGGMDFHFKLDPHYGVSTTRYADLATGLYIYFSRTDKTVEFGCQTRNQIGEVLTKGGKDDWDQLEDVFPLKHLSSITIDAFKRFAQYPNTCPSAINKLLNDPPPDYKSYTGSPAWIQKIYESMADKLSARHANFRQQSCRKIKR
ncbi:hypothetical protein FOL47_006173 [Perkinsus chesapeaki]|uniref:Uncharacterized protein n=1 Tax=Perkinsus chesapeaki TaxID=330153 RepID=A0A7J6LTI6_PERCH|nr:hypothetical protein FOL47_006173 [Perkinsus chesapeaki]